MIEPPLANRGSAKNDHVHFDFCILVYFFKLESLTQPVNYKKTTTTTMAKL